MQRPVRRPPASPGRGRAPARWTIWEVLLVTMSVAMIAFPLYATTLSIVSPPSAPAFQRATRTPSPTNTGPSETTAPPTNTSAPQLPTDTSAPQLPTDTSAPGVPTKTTVPPPPTNTSVPGVPTNTSVPPPPTNTVFVQPATDTPFVPSQPALQVLLFASAATASTGQQVSFSVSAITNSSSSTTLSVQVSIDSKLQVLNASSGQGSCTVSGQTASCSLTAQKGSPAAATVQTRVRTGVSGTASNQATASGGGASANSERVTVNLIDTGNPPTSVPTTPITTVPTTAVPTTAVPATATTVPGQPTVTTEPATATTVPGQPTVTTEPATATTAPGQPSNTAVPAATKTPKPSDSTKPDKPDPTEVPPPPPPPPLPPEAPQVPPPATARPAVPTRRPVRATPVPTRRPLTPQPPPPTATASSVAPQPSPTSAAPPPVDTNVFFRIASDWGSAYPNQEVRYTLVLRNTKPAAAPNAELKGVIITSNLPGNLEVLGANADRGGDPKIDGNSVQLTLDSLAPGQSVEISVRTKIRPTVPRGTLIVAQSQVQYNGLSAPLFSNVVTLLVVEAAPTASAPASQVKATLPPTLTAVPPSATSAAAAGAATATQGATTQSVAAPSATAAPNAAAPKPTAAPSAAAGGTSQLPDTSTGVPLFGFVLLGLTMLVRTVRLHRARERV